MPCREAKTESLRAQRQLSYRELRLDQSSSLALLVNREYVAEYCNHPWSRIALDYDLPADICGRSILDLLPPPWASSLRIFLDSCMANRVVENITCTVVSGRIKRTLEIQIQPVLEGAVISKAVELETILPPGISWEGFYRDEEGRMQLCSRCNRFRTSQGNEWHWVPALSATSLAPTISLTSCPACESGQLRSIVAKTAL
jgi:hypothetical protein